MSWVLTNKPGSGGRREGGGGRKQTEPWLEAFLAKAASSSWAWGEWVSGRLIVQFVSYPTGTINKATSNSLIILRVRSLDPPGDGRALKKIGKLPNALILIGWSIIYGQHFINSSPTTLAIIHLFNRLIFLLFLTLDT